MEGQQVNDRALLREDLLRICVNLVKMERSYCSPQELSHYLCEVADRIDLDFPVCEPDHPPTKGVEASSAQLVFSEPGFGEMVRPVDL